MPLDSIAMHPGIVVLYGAALAVGLVVDRSILALGHEPIALVVVDLIDRTVDGQLFVVGAQAITLGVLVSEQAALQQLIGRRLDAGDEVGGGEGSFLHIIEIVGRVGVQHELAYLNARIVLLGNDLGHVEDIVLVVQALLVGQDLHADLPLGVVAPVNGIVEIMQEEVRVLGGDLGSSLVGHVLHALLAQEVVLDPELLAFRVDPLEGVASVAVHVPVAGRVAPVTHQIGDLVDRLRGVRPEVPLHLLAAQVGGRVALLRVDEVGELQGVVDEEYGGVVAHHVVVAFLRVEAQGEAADVAQGVGIAGFAGHLGEAQQDGRGLACSVEYVGLGIGAHVLGQGEGSLGSGSLGVDYALWYALAVEVGQLFEELVVLHEDGPPGARRLAMVVVCPGLPFVGSKFVVHVCSIPLTSMFFAIDGPKLARSATQLLVDHSIADGRTLDKILLFSTVSDRGWSWWICALSESQISH